MEPSRSTRRATDALFYLGMATLFTHELDAMPNHEWRGLPVLGSMDDGTAMVAFVLLHVPLFAALIAAVASRREGIRRPARGAISTFVIIHAVLHTILKSRPEIEFDSVLSSVLIYGAAVFAAGHLGLAARERLAVDG